MLNKSSRLVIGAGAAMALGASLVACAPTASTGGGDTTSGSTVEADAAVQYADGQEVIDSYDVTELCGDEEITLAFPVGIANPWMKAVHLYLACKQ